MQRFILFGLLLVCLVCMFEATPVPQEDKPADDQFEKIKQSLQSFGENLQKQFKETIDNMNMNDAFESSKHMLENAAENLRKEAEKLVGTPSTA